MSCLTEIPSRLCIRIVAMSDHGEMTMCRWWCLDTSSTRSPISPISALLMLFMYLQFKSSSGIRGLMRGMATLPQGNQELLVVRDKVQLTPVELSVSKSNECDIFPSVHWHCWLGDRKGIRPIKKLDVGLLVVNVWLELCMTYSSSCHHHLHHPLLQWTAANPGSPGKWPLKRRER